MPYQFSYLQPILNFSLGEFPCPNQQCHTKFFVEIPLLVQNSRTRATLPTTVSQPTRSILVGQCYACQGRICLLCLNPQHVSSHCSVVPCPDALERFQAAWDAFERACPKSIRARHEESFEGEVWGELDFWDAVMLVHGVRSREKRFKELEEERERRSIVSLGDSEGGGEEEETEEAKEAREWEELRRELREAYEVLMGV